MWYLEWYYYTLDIKKHFTNTQKHQQTKSFFTTSFNSFVLMKKGSKAKTFPNTEKNLTCQIYIQHVCNVGIFCDGNVIWMDGWYKTKMKNDNFTIFQSIVSKIWIVLYTEFCSCQLKWTFFYDKRVKLGPN